MTARIPHLRLVVLFCGVAIVAYAGFSIWVVAISKDAAMIGDVIGAWKSFAVAAFSFWVGSSSGGKAALEAPVPVKVDQPANDPIPVEQKL